MTSLSGSIFCNSAISSFTFITFLLLKYHYHTRKRCRLLAIPELQPALDKSYFSLAIYPIVKPPCIRPRRNQHHDQSPFLAFIIALLNPFRQLSAVWWIAENRLPPPSPVLSHHPLSCSASRTWRFRVLSKDRE